MSKFVADCVCEARAGCGEGPVWDHRSGLLWWVDISGEKINAHDPVSGENRGFDAPCLVSSLVLAPEGLLIASARGIARVDTDTGALTPIDHPEPDVVGNRLNDIIVAPDGALWAGTMSEGGKGPDGALYRYGRDGKETMMTGATISNGLGWSPDGARLYFIDTIPGVLHVLENGQWRVLRSFSDIGKPDGMCVDSAGTLWIALCDRGGVIAMSPEGAIVDHIQLPCETVTSCAFGGADLRTLFVTTGTFSMSDAEKAANPLAGGLFAVQMNTPGIESFEARWPN